MHITPRRPARLPYVSHARQPSTGTPKAPLAQTSGGGRLRRSAYKVAYSPATAEATVSTFHRRRTNSRGGLHAPPDGLKNSHLSSAPLGTTPFNEEDEDRPYGKHMSLDHSPSPQQGGGWSSPGLTAPAEESVSRSRGGSPAKQYGDLNGGHVTWAKAKASSARVTGQASYQSQNQGFFGRAKRRLSFGLPYFTHGGQEDRYAEKEKLGRGRSWAFAPGRIEWKDLPARVGLLISRRRKHVALLLLFVLMVFMWFNESKPTLLS